MTYSDFIYQGHLPAWFQTNPQTPGGAFVWWSVDTTYQNKIINQTYFSPYGLNITVFQIPPQAKLNINHNLFTP